MMLARSIFMNKSISFLYSTATGYMVVLSIHLLFTTGAPTIQQYINMLLKGHRMGGLQYKYLPCFYMKCALCIWMKILNIGKDAEFSPNMKCNMFKSQQHQPGDVAFTAFQLMGYITPIRPLTSMFYISDHSSCKLLIPYDFLSTYSLHTMHLLSHLSVWKQDSTCENKLNVTHWNISKIKCILFTIHVYKYTVLKQSFEVLVLEYLIFILCYTNLTVTVTLQIEILHTKHITSNISLLQIKSNIMQCSWINNPAVSMHSNPICLCLHHLQN